MTAYSEAVSCTGQCWRYVMYVALMEPANSVTDIGERVLDSKETTFFPLDQSPPTP